MDALKQSTKTRSALYYARLFWRTLYSLRPSRQTLEHFITSFLLCGISFDYGPVPLGLCLLTICDKKYISAAALGAIAGYALYWGPADAFSLYAIGAILLCGRLFLVKPPQKQLIPPIFLCATAVIGLLFLIGASLPAAALIRWAINLICACIGTFLFEKAASDRLFVAKLLICCGMLLGLSAIHLPGGINPAVIALAWAAGSTNGLCFTAAGCGILAAVAPNTATYAVIFCPVALLYQQISKKYKVHRCIIACIIYALAGLMLQNYGFSICAAIGAALILFFPPEALLPAPACAKLPRHPVQQELIGASDALLQAAQMLTRAPSPHKREIADIFDSAAAQVCQSCAKYHACWQVSAQELYEDLTTCAEEFRSKGYAEIGNFPQRFLSQCIHAEAFVTATNDALDHVRAQRRLRSRLDEARDAARKQYEVMGLFLQRLSNRLYAPSVTVNFSPELAVQASGRGGSTISGDRGAAFEGPNGTYYVLLCDGMGSGSAAAQESTQAISMLRQFLLAGLNAGSALSTLNSVYILRDNGCFSTVDLLQINLTSGDAILYKWGAAPSYLKRQKGLRFLGGASLPPGVSQSEEMEQIRFSLDRSCVLILLSDGLGNKESQRRLESCESLHPEDVIRSLFVGKDRPDDDCTAVAVRLLPCAERTELRI